MEPVIEANAFFVSDLPRQNVGGMATRPQAAGVLNLGVGFGAVFLGHYLDYMVDGLELRPHRRLGLGRYMTGHTGHLIVLRGFPGLIVRPHDVATVAERGAHAVEKQASEKSQKSTPRDGQHAIKLRMEVEMNSNPLQKLLDPFLFVW